MMLLPVFFDKGKNILTDRESASGGVACDSCPLGAVKSNAAPNAFIRNRRPPRLVLTFPAPVFFIHVFCPPIIESYAISKSAAQFQTAETEYQIFQAPQPVLNQKIQTLTNLLACIMLKVYRLGLQAPACTMFNRIGQSCRKRTLRWLQVLLKLLTTKTGFQFFCSLFYLLFSNLALIIPKNNFFVNHFLKKNKIICKNFLTHLEPLCA